MEKFVAWSGETTERNGTQYKMQTPHPVLPKNIFFISLNGVVPITTQMYLPKSLPK